MFPQNVTADDASTRQLAEDDQQVLLGLVRRYGLSSILCALTGPASSRASTLSATTLLSATSAPSLAWTTSSDASQCRSDAASIRTQSTWPEAGTDVPSIHDPSEFVKPPERTWLDSPAVVGSPLPGQDFQSMASPRPIVPTNKKYQCPMCFQDNNPVGFGRKSDFKKHLHNFHGADVTWICRTKGCHLSFATERAYSTHAKEAHRMDALPNSAARTELCPQLAFPCGFASCKERIFEAYFKDESSSYRDRYFEHIAKHFEDGADVSQWEYHIQIHNLMRQQRVKGVWKTCIWPKEKRLALTWKPRSSGDLRRMLECRHLGEDISTLVRLAYILGTAPFTSSTTPPPSEIDLHFQLPFRSLCLLDTDAPSASPDGSSGKSEGGNGMNILKHRTSMPQAVLNKLPKGRSKRASRPTTPASALSDTPMRDTTMRDATMRDELAVNGPHPGTPISIPHEDYIPSDAPTFAPPESAAVLPRQNNNSPAQQQTPQQQHHHHHYHEEQQQQQQQQQHPDPPFVYAMSQPEQHAQPAWAGAGGSDAATIVQHEQPMPQSAAAAAYYTQATPVDFDECYNYPLSSSQASTVRPATPVPNRRPTSWSRAMSVESIHRPQLQQQQQSVVKQQPPTSSPFGSPCPDEEIPPAMMYGGQGPTSVPMHMAMDGGGGGGAGGYVPAAYHDQTMRMAPTHDEPHPQPHHHHHNPHHYAHAHSGFPSISSLPPQMQLNSPTTFFFDDETRY